MEGRDEDLVLLQGTLAQTLSPVLAAFLAFEIRHGLRDGDPFAPETGLAEQGFPSLSDLGFALVPTRLDRANASPVLRLASLAFGAAVLVQGLLWPDGSRTRSSPASRWRVRALSFLGLGAVPIGIGPVYRSTVFTPPERRGAPGGCAPILAPQGGFRLA